MKAYIKCVVFFKIIQMRLDLCEEGDGFKELTTVKRLFNEFEMTCPFMPKIHIKRALELKGDFVVLKLKDGLVNQRMNTDQLVTELVEVLVEYKKKGINIKLFGSKILELMKKYINGIFNCGKQLEALIPECEEFKDFQIDLLNILTELTLNQAGNCKKSAQFSELVTEAINLNVKSLNLRPNVMGYFEFLKLTKLQDPRDFPLAVETCLATLKNRIGPNEDIRGKLQIIRLIVNEENSLKKGLEFAFELFGNCDLNTTILLEDLLCLIEENTKKSGLNVEIEKVLIKFGDQIRQNKKVQRSVLETLLRLADKNSTVKEDYLRCEEILNIINDMKIGFDDEGIKIKLAKCYLKLDKLTEARDALNDYENGGRDWCLLRLELALRVQDNFGALEMIEKLSIDPVIRSEHFLILYNELKVRLNSEMKMKLLKTAQRKLDRNNCGLRADLLRGIVSLVYDGVIESGLTVEYQRELEACFSALLSDANTLAIDQVDWMCQVCWNLGVIHARAEDFISAQFGFKWCQVFSQYSEESKEEFAFKAGFYYLTAKMCGSEEINEEDYEVLRSCCETEGDSVSLMCLKIEMLLRSKKWEDLKYALSNNSTVGFESLAEIVLRASEEIPLEVYRLILDKLTENEFESQSFDLIRFAGLYRGLTTCALLQYPSDLSHFHSAVKMIKSSFGRYPCEETVWLCGTALEMGRQAADGDGEWEKAAEWTEMAMNLVYLIPTENDEDKIIKTNLQESIQKLFEKVVNRD